MTDISGSEWALIITAAGTFLTAMTSSAAVIIGALNARRINRQSAKIEEVHRSTNGLKDELVNSTAVANHALGVIAGRREVNEENGKP